jgi:hypothetical protein
MLSIYEGKDIETELNNENALIDYLQGSHISLEYLKGLFNKMHMY